MMMMLVASTSGMNESTNPEKKVNEEKKGVK